MSPIPIAPLLILQGISEKSRIQNEDILAEAVKIAKFAEQEGRYYHPAANAALDKLTNGYSSRFLSYLLFISPFK